MKKEVIFVIAGSVIIVLVLILVIIAMNPGPWERRPDTGLYPGNRMGPGMMGYGMTGQGMSGGMGMMSVYTADSRPIAEADARTRATAFADRYYPGTTTGDFMEFSLNYYVELKDASNASVAEILVDRYTGTVTPEPGPNMIWNTGNRRHGTSQAVTHDVAEGKTLAETFLAGYLPGATVQESTSYPGYYTYDFGRGKTEGMLSVNAYTGSIWVHTWHGQFIGE